MGQPKVKLKPTPLGIFLEVISALGLVFHLGYLIYVYPDLFESILSQAGVEGEMHQRPSISTFMKLPIISICVFVVLTLGTFFPHHMNYPVNKITALNVRFMYRSMIRMILFFKMIITYALAYSSFRKIQVYLYSEGSYPSYQPYFIGSIFFVLGFTFFRMLLYRPKKSKTI